MEGIKEGGMSCRAITMSLNALTEWRGCLSTAASLFEAIGVFSGGGLIIEEMPFCT